MFQKCLNVLLLSCLFSLGFVMIAQAQSQGCTDPNATNYNPTATENDGSCLYPRTQYTSARMIDTLSQELAETSALLYWHSSIWTINDSGNPAFLYELDTADGQIKNRYYLKDAQHIDWEALSQNDSFIFIGDFGNNRGNRRNLKILRLSKSELLQSASDTLHPEFIHFSYSDQTDFSPANLNTAFDAEAFICYHDTLFIFTKDWQHYRTKVYTLPNTIGQQVAQLKDSFSVEGLITDASLDPNSKHLLLLGYTNSFQVFTWLLWDYPGTSFFKGNKRAIEMGDILQYGQAEGICLVDSFKGYISGERITYRNSTISQNLHAFNFQEYFKPNFPNHINHRFLTDHLNFYPNPFKETLWLKTPKSNVLVIYDLLGKIHLQQSMVGGIPVQISTQSWPLGVYLIKVLGVRGAHSIIKR